MNWISTNDLNLWANSRDAQDTLPMLIARLIRASVSRIDHLNFPSGDHVQRGGWDGILKSNEKTAYIPEGISLWEFGAGKGVKKKLNDDFLKRSNNPEGYDLYSSTFIFITPRPFKNKNKWIEEKMKEGKWKDIRIYDDEILYQWIDSCPSVGNWLAIFIGKFPEKECKSLDSFWDAWSTGEEFNISPSLLLTDRESQVQDLINRFQQERIIIVRGPSKSEAIAFIIAAFLCQEDGGYDFLAKGLIVQSSQLLEKLASHKTPLYFIIDFEDIDSLYHVIKKGHKVLVPVGDTSSIEQQDSITLPSMSNKGFVESLMHLGLPLDRAEAYSKESARSITILRRLRKFNLSQPVWAKDSNVYSLVPFLLLGGWNEAHHGDIDVIEAMAGNKYPEYIRKIDPFLSADDSPIMKLGDIWKLKSPLDSYTYLSKHITKADIDIFKVIWIKVFEEIDPKFTLDPDRRLFANLHGKGRHYSSVLRRGLCQSLLLLSFFEKELNSKLGHSISLIPENLIADLLKSVDPQLWMSIHDQLPLIAEAAPKVFIQSLDSQLNIPDSPISELFKEERGLLFPQSYIPGLLWAIEGLAWYPEFFPQCCLLLSRLAEMDPGGSTSNRPINSLKEIFKPWHPGTYSSVSDRLRVLSLIKSRFPNAAWDLFVSLLPSDRDFSMGTNKSKWLYLLLSPKTYKIESATKEFYDTVIESLLDLSEMNPGKIAELIRKSQTFPPYVREKVLEVATQRSPDIIDNDRLIWNELRSIISHHTSAPSADWRLSSWDLAKYVELRKLYEVKGIITIETWLFEEHWPKLPDGFPPEIDSYENQEQFIQNLRLEFVKDLLAQQKIEGLLAYNELLTNRYFFAETIARLEISKEDIKALLLQFNRGAKSAELIKRFVYVYTFKKEVDDFLTKADFLLQIGLDEKAIIEIFASAKQGKSIWSNVAKLGPTASNIFWTILDPHFGILADDEIEIAIENLLEVGRPFTVLSEITHHVKIISTTVLQSILTQCSQGPSNESPFLNEYSLRTVFEEIQSRTDIVSERIVVLEWLFLPLLIRSGRDSINLKMKKHISLNPGFFNTIMEVLYDSDSEAKLNSIQSENRFRFLMACDEVLSSIDIVPGQNQDNSINKEIFREWIEDVRQEAIDKERIGKVDFEIGRILGNFSLKYHSQSEVIYEYLEETKSKSLSDGFSSGIKSTGKATWRSMDAGGKIEWKKHEEILARESSLRTLFPYVATIYSDIADYYKEKAQKEDREAHYHTLDED